MNMKKITTLFLVFAAALMMTACNRDAKIYSSPEEVSKKFLTAFYTADFDGQRKYSTKRTQKLVDVTERTMHTDAMKDHLAEMKDNKVEINEIKLVSQDDSISICNCDFLYNGMQRNITYYLYKQEDKWLVDLTND